MGVCLVLWLFGLWLDMDGARSCVPSPFLGSVHAYQGASTFSPFEPAEHARAQSNRQTHYKNVRHDAVRDATGKNLVERSF